MKEQVIKCIETAKVVAIIRADDGLAVRNKIEYLVKAGITALEITSNTPGFCDHITWARNNFPDVVIGAGTIINVGLMKQAKDAQAQFVVTPNMDTDVIKEAKASGIVTMMGALTPTDVALGINNGADFIKLFPAGTMGPSYLKALLGPYKGTKFFAVGGVNNSNINEWFAAGVTGVGMGDSLVNGSAETIYNSVVEIFNKIKI